MEGLCAGNLSASLVRTPRVRWVHEWTVDGWRILLGTRLRYVQLRVNVSQHGQQLRDIAMGPV